MTLDIRESNGIKHDIANSPKTGRSASAYHEYFNLSPEKLEGKKILDLGAGRSTFADETNEFGAEVTRLDPSYVESKPIGEAPAVAGIAQYLPFASETFDLSLASFSFFRLFTGRNKALEELVRVTKNDGEIKIYPVKLRFGIEHLPDEGSIFALENQKTLVITKKPNKSPGEWHDIVEQLAQKLEFSYLMHEMK